MSTNSRVAAEINGLYLEYLDFKSILNQLIVVSNETKSNYDLTVQNLKRIANILVMRLKKNSGDFNKINKYRFIQV